MILIKIINFKFCILPESDTLCLFKCTLSKKKIVTKTMTNDAIICCTYMYVYLANEKEIKVYINLYLTLKIKKKNLKPDTYFMNVKLH